MVAIVYGLENESRCLWLSAPTYVDALCIDKKQLCFSTLMLFPLCTHSRAEIAAALVTTFHQATTDLFRDAVLAALDDAIEAGAEGRPTAEQLSKAKHEEAARQRRLAYLRAGGACFLSLSAMILMSAVPPNLNFFPAFGPRTQRKNDWLRLEQQQQHRRKRPLHWPPAAGASRKSLKRMRMPTKLTKKKT